jgi:hypothetical protein
MSENLPRSAPRRAPLIKVLGIFALFALFLGVLFYAYLPRRTGVFPDDGVRTAEQRKKLLAELQAKVAKQRDSYGWVDQKAGVVQLPIERAMELTLQQYAKKP